MALFTFLSSLFKSNSEPQEVYRSVEFSDHVVTIHSLGFTGRYAKSPNGRWAIAWDDGDIPADGAIYKGIQAKGLGRFVVLRDGRFRGVGHAERPNACAIANNGSFVLQDLRSEEQIQSVFKVYDKDCVKLVEFHQSAHIYSSAISDNGVIAVCHTANARNSDGNMLTAFDLNSGAKLFSITPETGRASSYVFDEANRRVGAVLKDVGTFYYSADGVLEDPDGFLNAKLNSANPLKALSEIEEVSQFYEISEDQLEYVLRLSGSLLEDSNINDTPNTKARLLKARGKLLQASGRDQEALSHYNEALEIDPAIGVKRVATAIQKKLAKPNID